MGEALQAKIDELAGYIVNLGQDMTTLLTEKETIAALAKAQTEAEIMEILSPVVDLAKRTSEVIETE